MIDDSKDMRWMMNNFMESGYGSFVVSSEDPDKPKLNMINGAQRTEVFKFGGRFLIEEDVNDHFYIDYLGSQDYTIPSGDYGSLEELLTAMNTASANVWIFSADENNIVSLSSAIGPYVIALVNRNYAVWDTIGFTQISNEPMIANEVYVADEARVHWPYEEITVDFGYQAPIGFIAMISDLAEEVRIPEGATITIMANTVNSFVTPPLSQTIPWYKTGCFKFIDDVADSAWRYVKIRIECPSGPFIPEIGYLYIGDYQTSGVRNIGTGFGLDFEDASNLSSSDEGQIYGNSKTPVRAYSSLEIGLARPAQAAFLKQAYAYKQKLIPFFVALDPKVYLSDSFDEHLSYVRFTASPRYVHILRNIFQLSFELKEAL